MFMPRTPRNPVLASKPYTKRLLVDHVKENLIAGVEPHQKRVVVNLAERSRIFNTETGTFRTYDDFVSDWTYIGSRWVPDETCTLCGKQHIRRACTIEDEGTGDRMVVGSECVHTHLTIITDAGEHLTGDAKKDFLKAEMEKAKDRFFKAAWDADWADEMALWPEIYRLHNEVIYRSNDRNDVRRIQRRLDSKGYISEGTSMHLWWTTRAPSFVAELARNEAIITHHTTMQARAARAASDRVADANAFRTRFEWLTDLNCVPRGITVSDALRVESAVRRYGKEGLRWGNDETYARVMAAVPGTPAPVNPFDGIEGTSEWERGFLKSVGDRLADGRSLSPRQNEVLIKVLKGLGLNPEDYL